MREKQSLVSGKSSLITLPLSLDLKRISVVQLMSYTRDSAVCLPSAEITGLGCKAGLLQVFQGSKLGHPNHASSTMGPPPQPQDRDFSVNCLCSCVMVSDNWGNSGLSSTMWVPGTELGL